MNATHTDPSESAGLVADLVERHYPEIFAYLYRLLKDRETAQQIAQETFLRGYEACQELGRAPDRRLRLFAVASSLAGAAAAVPSRRLLRGRQGCAAIAPVAIPRVAELQDMHWGYPQPIERALVALPLTERALILLCRHHGFDLPQAGLVLGLRTAVALHRLAAAYQTCAVVYVPDLPGAVHDAMQPLLANFTELDAAQRELLAAHTQRCASCAARMSLFRQIDGDLANLADAWPARHAWLALAQAVRHGAVMGLPRLVPLPVLPVDRVPIWMALVLLLVIGAGLGWWLVGRTDLGRLTRRAPTPVAAAAPAELPSTPAPAPTPTPTPPPRVAGAPGSEALAWLRLNAVPVSAVEPGSPATDLAPLQAMLGDARILDLDDPAGFGSHEAQAFRQRILEFLVRGRGFNLLVLQTDWATGQLLDHYIQGGDGDPLQLLDQVRQSRGVAGGVWQSQELLYTLRWLRAYNARPGSGRVSIRGFLPLTYAARQPLDLLVQYLRRVDPPAVKRAYGDHQDLLAFLRDQRDAYSARTTFAAYRQALNAAEILVQYDRYMAAGTAQERASLYDSAALQNAMALADEFGAGGRALVWTQNLALEGLPSVAELLQSARRQNGAAVIITISFGEGSLYLAGKADPVALPRPSAITNQYGVPALSGLATYTLPAPYPGAYEDYLGQAGPPRYYLDLRRAYGDDRATAWLRLPQLVRSLTTDYWDCFPEDYYRRVRPTMNYDVQVYFQHVTPVTLLLQPPPVPHPTCLVAPAAIEAVAGIRGWSMQGDSREYVFGAAAAPTPLAGPAGFIRSTSSRTPLTWGVLAQDFRADAYRGHRILFSAQLLAEDGSARADLALTISGVAHEVLVYNLQAADAGAGWQRGEIVVDVPDGATRISLGAQLRGQGWVWLANEQAVIVDAKVPTTAPPQVRPH